MRSRQGLSAEERIREINRTNLPPREKSLKLRELAAEYGCSTSHLYYDTPFGYPMHDDDTLIKRILEAERSRVETERHRREQHLAWWKIAGIIAAILAALAAIGGVIMALAK